MFELVRNYPTQKAWCCDDVQVLLSHGRLHVIHGLTLNFSVGAGDVCFHAGTPADLVEALARLLPGVEPATALADHTADPRAVWARREIVQADGAAQDATTPPAV